MNKISKVILKIENLNYFYENQFNKIEIFKDLNLEMKEGEIIGLLGPSGSGKTTLLNCIGLLDSPKSGIIKILNVNCNHANDFERTKIRSKQIGFVFQNHRLFPEFSSIENIIIPQLLLGIDKKIAYKNASELLKLLNLKHRSDHRPARLSGGEAQRVAIARSVANAPKIILADEPTGNLDIESAKLVFDLLYKIVKMSKISCLIATHNVDLAKKMDKIYSIKDKKLKLTKNFN